VVLAAFAGSEVVWTEETVVCQHQTACCHAVVIGMISYRAAYTSSQSTWNQNTEEQKQLNPCTSGLLIEVL